MKWADRAGLGLVFQLLGFGSLNGLEQLGLIKGFIFIFIFINWVGSKVETSYMGCHWVRSPVLSVDCGEKKREP